MDLNNLVDLTGFEPVIPGANPRKGYRLPPQAQVQWLRMLNNKKTPTIKLGSLFVAPGDGCGNNLTMGLITFKHVFIFVSNHVE